MIGVKYAVWPPEIHQAMKTKATPFWLILSLQIYGQAQQLLDSVFIAIARNVELAFLRTQPDPSFTMFLSHE